MQYNIAQLLKEPIGSERTYQLDEHLAGPQLGTDVARGPVHILRTHQGVLINATLEIRSALNCSRCLDGFDRSSTLYIEEEFFPPMDTEGGRSLGPPAESEGRWLTDAGQVLDLTEVVRECVVTDLPMKSLCGPECSGLCQTCGVNLNLAGCDCSASAQDSRWEALAGLQIQRRG
jgi:uncharacterized protein